MAKEWQTSENSDNLSS